MSTDTSMHGPAPGPGQAPPDPVGPAPPEPDPAPPELPAELAAALADGSLAQAMEDLTFADLEAWGRSFLALDATEEEGGTP